MQRKQHAEKRTAEGAFKVCLYKAGVHVMYVCVCVCRMRVDFCSSAVNTADAHANN